MTEFIRIPAHEEFSNLVDSYESSYKTLDDIYVAALQLFENKKLSNLNYSDVESILHPYLLKWGKMRRVLGFKGCNRIGDKLREMDLQLTKSRQEALSTVDLDRLSSEFVDIYARARALLLTVSCLSSGGYATKGVPHFKQLYVFATSFLTMSFILVCLLLLCRFKLSKS